MENLILFTFYGYKNEVVIVKMCIFVARTENYLLKTNYKYD